MEFSTKDYPTHEKGKETRLEILAALGDFPKITLLMIARWIRKSIKQTGKHLQQLVAERQLKNSGGAYTINN